MNNDAPKTKITLLKSLMALPKTKITLLTNLIPLPKTKITLSEKYLRQLNCRNASFLHVWLVNNNNIQDKSGAIPDKPSEFVLKKAFASFGDVRMVDIPMLDPYRHKVGSFFIIVFQCFFRDCCFLGGFYVLVFVIFYKLMLLVNSQYPKLVS